MSTEENKQIFRRFIEEFWNQRNLEVADELFAPDAVSPTAPQLPRGPQGVKEIGGMVLRGFPDFHMTIEDLVAEGDKVAARFMERGTHRGEFMGIAPTGNQATWTEIGILRIKDGKVVESWFQTDMLGLMRQLGAIAVPAS
jgi:predicted ester cyclase